jgi:hypothetical protein
MSDIAKLLVETTARLMARGIDGFSDCEEAYLNALRPKCANGARAIVAEFYGPPCDGKPEVDELFGDIPCFSGDRPDSECSRCGWPRGEHGRTRA